MIHSALLAAALLSPANEPSNKLDSPVHTCFASMEGAVYQGDPSNRSLLKANVAACNSSIAQLQRMRSSPSHGPERLFLLGWLLDRAATLSYMGLGDARTALRDVRRADRCFRIAAALPNQTGDFHETALANAELTRIQLHTLRADPSSAKAPRITP
ncbi:MAG: hypothetical protein IAI50_01360 [Candidatus Eremiobacteraeota bacterium]|nr:hypothetical protein [Candidatus Eremiobacteraeota bacterium]